MKYICYKTTVSKVFDADIKEQEDILNLLNHIKDKQLTCSVQLKLTPLYDSVRLLTVNENSISYRLIKDGVTLQKNAKIEDIVLLQVYSNDEVTLKLKPNPSRWSTLDPTGV